MQLDVGNEPYLHFIFPRRAAPLCLTSLNFTMTSLGLVWLDMQYILTRGRVRYMAERRKSPKKVAENRKRPKQPAENRKRELWRKPESRKT